MGDRLGRGLAYTCGCAKHREFARDKHALSRSSDEGAAGGLCPGFDQA